MEGHPVQFFGPSVPVPIRCGISECTDIQEISKFIRRGCRCLIIRPGLRNGTTATTPAHHCMASLTKIQVECIADCTLTASGDCKLSFRCVYFISVASSAWLNIFQLNILQRTYRPFNSLTGRFRYPGCFVTRAG